LINNNKDYKNTINIIQSGFAIQNILD